MVATPLKFYYQKLKPSLKPGRYFQCEWVSDVRVSGCENGWRFHLLEPVLANTLSEKVDQEIWTYQLGNFVTTSKLEWNIALVSLQVFTSFNNSHCPQEIVLISSQRTLHSEISHSVESRFGVGASKIEWEKNILTEFWVLSN